MIEARIALALLDGLWQGALVALVAGAILRLVRTNAATRYAVWIAVLAMVALLPLADFARASLPQANAADRAPAAWPVQADDVGTRTIQPRAPAQISPPRSAVHSSDMAMPHAFVVPVRRVAIRFVLGILLALGLLRLVALGRGYLAMRRMARAAVTLERELPAGVSPRIRLASSERVAVPAALGLGSQTILVPSPLLDEVDETDLEQIVLHEAAHLARRDDLTNLFAQVVVAVLFFHPVVYAIARYLDLEREIACDDWVIAATGRRRTYALSLTKVAEVALGSVRRASPALGLFASRKTLRTRVEHLLDSKADALPRRSRLAGIAVAGLAAIAVAVTMVRLPVVATTAEPPPIAQVAPPAPPAPAPKAPQTVRREEIIVIRAPHALRAPAPIGIDAVRKAHRHVEQDLRKVIVIGQDGLPAPMPHGLDVVHDSTQRVLKSVEVIRVATSHLAAASAALDRGIDEMTIGATVAAATAPAPALLHAHGACSGCSFENADLHGRDLRGINFVGANLSGADLRGADLRGARLSGANAASVKLGGAKLQGALLVGINLSRCACSEADFTNARLEGANLETVDAARARFNGGHMTGTNLHGADLTGATLNNAMLTGADFVGAKVDGADFSGAHVLGTNFAGVDLSRANMSGVIDEHTRRYPYVPRERQPVDGHAPRMATENC